MLYTSSNLLITTWPPSRLILNFYIAPITLLTTYYLLTMLLCHENTTVHYSNIGDSASRLFLNDFFLNSYYLFWTSFWYLPTLILTLSVLYLINLSKTSTKLYLIYLNFLLLVTILHYQNQNPYNYILDDCGVNFNTLLSNSVNKFHPALFYISLLPLILPTLFITIPNKYRYLYAKNLKLLRFHINTLIIVIVYTLYLGSWWALQEGSWGGWWNWDPSEVFGLIVMVYYLYTLHKLQKIDTYWTLILVLSICTRTTLFIYLFIQLNFDLVSHNFGTRIDQFIDTTQLLLFLSLVVLLTILIITKRFFFLLITDLSVITLTSSYSHKLKITWTTFISLVVLLVLILSFTLLLNDFLWKLLNINLFNGVAFTYFYTSFIITGILIRMWDVKIYSLLLIYYLFYSSKNVLILFLWAVVTKVNILHMGLIVLLFSILSELSQSTSTWELLYESCTLTNYKALYDSKLPHITLNNFIIEHLNVVLVNNTVTELLWNLTLTDSSPEGHSFGHCILDDLLSQLLYSSSSISNYTINVLDFSINTTNCTFALIIVNIYLVVRMYVLIIS